MISFNLPSAAVQKHKKSFSWLDTGPNKKWHHKAIEMIVFALIVPIVGYVFFRHDPVGLNSGFPWIIIPPVIFAARYGSVWGFSCAVLTAATLIFPFAAYAEQTTYLVALAVGTIILSIFVGDFANAGKKQNSLSHAENQYLRHRLKEFSKDYHILKVSHSQLEEFMAGNRLSVRQALQELKPLLSTNQSGELKAGSELMAIFAQFGAVQVAGLYGIKSRDRIDPAPIATHGDMLELNLFDPLVKLAIDSRQLVSVKLEAQATETIESELLAVVPIVDSHDHLHGILAIKDMHFMAFQQENLNVLALMGSYIGDMLSRSQGQGQSQNEWFIAELKNAVRFAQTNNVQSSLLVMKMKNNDLTQTTIDWLSENLRSLDSAWQPNAVNGGTSVVILLPLMKPAQTEAYLQRAAKKMFEDTRIDLSGMTEVVSTRQIKKRDTKESCLAFIEKVTQYNEGATKRKLPFGKGREKKKRVA